MNTGYMILVVVLSLIFGSAFGFLLSKSNVLQKDDKKQGRSPLFEIFVFVILTLIFTGRDKEDEQ